MRGLPRVGGRTLQEELGTGLHAARRAPHSLAGAGPLHLGEELLLHRVEQVGAEVARVQQDLVLQGDLRGERDGDQAGLSGKAGEERPLVPAPRPALPRSLPSPPPAPRSRGRTSSPGR